MPKDTRLVYSTDPELNKRCPACKELMSECACEAEPDPSQLTFKAKLRIEKSGRGGKVVTVVAGLPASQDYLKDLSQKLKRSCGVGGTFKIEGKEGRVEIQGDNREKIRKALEGLGIKHAG